MDLLITNDESGREYLDRVHFTKMIMDQLSGFLNSIQLQVIEVKSNYIVVVDASGDSLKINLHDPSLELELKLLVYILIGSKFMSTPEIVFMLSDDKFDNFILEGFGLSDLGGIVASSYESGTIFDYSVTLKARYLMNLLRYYGIITLISSSSSDPKKLLLNPNSNIIITDDFLEDASDDFEPEPEDEEYNEEKEDPDGELRELPKSSDAFSQIADHITKSTKYESKDPTIPNVSRPRATMRPPTIASVVKKDRQRKLYRKKLRLLRVKDPASHRRRSRAAKMRWRQNRTKYIQGMKRFHRSSIGRRINKHKGQLISLRRRQAKK